MTNEAFQENVAKRELDTESIFFASFLAGLNLYGILNQAIINKASDRAGAHLARFAKLQDEGKLYLTSGKQWSVRERFEKSVEVFKKMLFVSKEVDVIHKEKETVISIETGSCRFCPKGVGEAELNGTLCPFPALMKSFSNELWGKDDIKLHKERSKPILVKEGDRCVFEYREKNPAQ
jgi:hypothetical protein